MSALPSRSRTCAALVAAAVAAGACTGSSSTHAGKSVFSPALTACANYEAPSSHVQLPDPSAPAYAGAGPHLAVVGEHLEPNAKGMNHIPPSTYSLPGDWEASDAASLEPDPSHAQLIVCLSQVAERAGTSVGTCAYDKTRADVYPADYTFAIYTARTGRRVSTFVATGDEPAQRSCPQVVAAGRGKDFRIAQALSPTALAGRLRSLVTGPAH